MLPDRDQLAFSVSPDGVLPRGEVPGGQPVRPQLGEFVLPGFLAGLPHHPGLVEEVLAVRIEFTGPQ